VGKRRIKSADAKCGCVGKQLSRTLLVIKLSFLIICTVVNCSADAL